MDNDALCDNPIPIVHWKSETFYDRRAGYVRVSLFMDERYAKFLIRLEHRYSNYGPWQPLEPAP